MLLNLIVRYVKKNFAKNSLILFQLTKTVISYAKQANPKTVQPCQKHTFILQLTKTNNFSPLASYTCQKKRLDLPSSLSNPNTHSKNPYCSPHPTPHLSKYPQPSTSLYPPCSANAHSNSYLLFVLRTSTLTHVTPTPILFGFPQPLRRHSIFSTLRETS